ncbi:helix-turn-helix domain-containing protein [Streptococcus suis]|uniref:AraC family transcriptional regulator n=1 Tax=Streptococcus suis TaxID=1307 RepID=A0A822VJJ3_STRSU|nr:AraC family transcriptional regulator [Streptococcus suis]AGZ22394.1 AraC family transcriptional regulator [Streptococcus suis T15]MCG9861026.1 AraC family transcriptional regulator [Streptococcus suis]MCG9863795.1 AraC family transcriptional regulator [Streptococcus suis]MCG9866417.1 AraC family transcriptional regulator [Streptococcus suis]MCG9868567.1 AraC family transcriptional regulator [Streptococcus suis]
MAKLFFLSDFDFFLVEDIAHRFGVSVRLLQRNLSAESTNFKQELQAVQKAMTFSYLKMKLPAEMISSLIGYSEVNAFSRAFKKWTGMTVTDYKKCNRKQSAINKDSENYKHKKRGWDKSPGLLSFFQ